MKTQDKPAAHTPGPWNVMPPHITRALSLRIFAGNKFLASVGNSDDSLVETQANADLIAAAPELLAEAKVALAWFLSAFEMDSLTENICIGLETAIAKAEGRE